MREGAFDRFVEEERPSVLDHPLRHQPSIVADDAPLSMISPII
ncbi:MULTISPECIES: hypothetical protein [unclassified Beijerinckia]|nr:MULTISPECIES: hypothetical protein [unclassified Beijerinckia]MDH7796031.1 hypothetical protein [Beijerinckia sp. GAS462]